jgi:hypothetical protein
MKQQRTRTPANLAALALGFVVQVQGSWTTDALQGLRAELTRRGLAPTEPELTAALVQAQQHFSQGTAHLFLCMGRPCHRRHKFDMSEQALRQGLDESRLLLSTTECQGPCKQAPLATLRVGQRSTMFAQFAQEADWQAVRGFAQRAASAGTLLTEAGSADPFLFDPVHEHEHDHGSVALRKLQFLLGHFQGEGQEVTRPEPFQKELVGSREAGGRCIALRMGVTYPLADGRKDTHNAFVAIAVNPQTEGIEARAYTDGGGVHDFRLRLEGDTVMFDERPDAHYSERPARKILRPTADGFEERLEVDHGDGCFETHFVVTMQRVTPNA